MKEREERFCNTHGKTMFSQTGGKNRWRCVLCCQERVVKRRKQLKIDAVEYKGGKCEICGYTKCIEALEFHHRNSFEKDFNISYKGRTNSWVKVKNELDKCMLLCANCHREIHAYSRSGWQPSEAQG